VKPLYNGKIKMQGTRSAAGHLQEAAWHHLFNLFDFISPQW
jgi:hypothetical protein